MTTPAQAPYPNRKPDSSTSTTISPKGGRASSAGRGDDNKFDIHIESPERSPLKKVAGILFALALLGGAYYMWRAQMNRAPSSASPAAENQTPSANSADFSMPAPPTTATAQISDVVLVHGLVKIRDFQAFVIDVPPHTVRPHVHGQFQSVGAAAAVDLLLMDDQQYEDFVNHRPIDWLQGQEGAKSADVDWLLHPTVEDAGKYYLVFAASQRGGTATVKADFTVSLE